MTFVLIFFIYLKRIKFKKLLILASLILILLISFFQVTKNTKPGKKFYNTFDNLIIVENNKLSINFKDEFYNSRHAYHYITAYKIF